MSTCIRQTAASRPNSFSILLSYFVAQYVLIMVVQFFWKYILVFEKWFFSFDRSNMQISTLNITRVVWPHVTNLLDLRYFYRHNPLFYHLNLIPWHYWGWQKNIYFIYFLNTCFYNLNYLACKRGMKLISFGNETHFRKTIKVPYWRTIRFLMRGGGGLLPIVRFVFFH